MEHKKTIIPSMVDFHGIRQIWDVKEIRLCTAVTLEGLNSVIFGFFFILLKTNHSLRLHSRENIYSTIVGITRY